MQGWALRVWAFSFLLVRPVIGRLRCLRRVTQLLGTIASSLHPGSVCNLVLILRTHLTMMPSEWPAGILRSMMVTSTGKKKKKEIKIEGRVGGIRTA